MLSKTNAIRNISKSSEKSKISMILDISKICKINEMRK